MPGQWLHSLSGRFLIVVALLLVTFSVTMTALAAHQEATARYGELERTARGTGQLLEPSATNWVLRGDISDLEQAMRVVRNQPGVVDAYILDRRGRVLADGTGAGPGRSTLAGVHNSQAMAAGRAGVLRQGSVLDAVNPLETSGERLGTLVVGYDQTEADATIQASRERHLLTGLGFAVVGLIMTWLLVRGVTSRLLLLTQAAQAAATEQLPRLVRGLRAGGDPADLAPPALDVRSSDEVGRLVGAFNSYRSVVVDMATDLTALANNSDARLRRAFDGSPIGMALTTPTGQFLEVNDALCTMLGRARSQLLGATFDALSHPQDRQGATRDKQGATRDKQGARRDKQGAAREPRTAGHAGQTQRRYLRPDGSIVWTLHTDTVETEPDGTPGHIFSQVVDTTEQKRSEAEMAYLAFHDMLTGLANRARLVQVLEYELDRAREGAGQVAVILLDLDRFKLINDSLGHAAGDELLQTVSRRLTAAVRLGDTVGRLGGDEFVVICAPDCTTADAEAAARRILDALRDPVTIAGQTVHTSASLGVAVGAGDRHPVDLLRDADTAAYAAKNAGRSSIVIFDDALRRQAENRLRLEADLRRGIETGEFFPVYQPLVLARTGEIFGFEALARWNDGGHTRPPADFIEAAEDTGLIVALGRQILNSACRDLAAWLGQSPSGPRTLSGPSGPNGARQDLRISVNVAPQQLLRADFIVSVLKILAEHDLAPAALCIEITEATLMDSAAEPAVAALRELGVCVAIDDFGTGYSSLAYLRRLPVDIVKIDRSFMSDLEVDPTARSVVAAIIDLSHAMGLLVLAEGVETPGQAVVLTDLGCDLLQGFGLAHPMPRADVPGTLATWRPTRARGAVVPALPA